MRRRCLWSMLILLLMVAMNPGVTGHAAQTTDNACAPAMGEALVIGAVFPPDAVLVTGSGDAYRGAFAMVAAVNACGGVDGRPVELAFEAASSRRQGAEAASRLIEAGVSLIVGSGSTAVSEGVREVTEQAGVVYWEVTEPLDDEGLIWSFSANPTSRQLGEQAAIFAESALAESLELNDLRVALIYEERERGRAIAEGIRENLEVPPLIEVGYEDRLSGSIDLGRAIREAEASVVFMVAFNADADRLWYGLRQADANVAAWVHVGSAGFRRDLCERYGNHEGVISISMTGPVNTAYHAELAGTLLSTYDEAYRALFDTAASSLADLSAGGTYLLLRHVLPGIDGEMTPDTIREAILALDLEAPIGLRGEGLRFDPVAGANLLPGVIVQQRQVGGFCSVWPETIATCEAGIAPFMTWRERAVAENETTCE